MNQETYLAMNEKKTIMKYKVILKSKNYINLITKEMEKISLQDNCIEKIINTFEENGEYFSNLVGVFLLPDNDGEESICSEMMLETDIGFKNPDLSKIYLYDLYMNSNKNKYDFQILKDNNF